MGTVWVVTYWDNGTLCQMKVVTWGLGGIQQAMNDRGLSIGEWAIIKVERELVPR